METIETDRLILRAWTDDDINEYIRVFTKPEVLHFPFGRGFTEEEAQLRVERHISAHSRGEVDQWAAVVKATQTVIGWIGLSYALDYPGFEHLMQVGWRLEPDAWGEGYATEGGSASVQYAFENFPIDDLYVFAQPENSASIAVGKRLGATYVGEAMAGDILHAMYVIRRSR
jgi:RimJ/RimL family protein N-acetyltransferase